jgi:hypothetical protein
VSGESKSGSALTRSSPYCVGTVLVGLWLNLLILEYSVIHLFGSPRESPGLPTCIPVKEERMQEEEVSFRSVSFFFLDENEEIDTGALCASSVLPDSDFPPGGEFSVPQ